MNKKKLFISLPMKGRTEEAIQDSMVKMHRIAKIVFGEEDLEVIETFITENPPEDLKNKSVWYLGKSIEKLAEADYFIGISDDYDWSGCAIENHVAREYGIKSYFLSNYQEIMPDAGYIARNFPTTVHPSF